MYHYKQALQLVEAHYYDSNAAITADGSRWAILFSNIIFCNSGRVIGHTFPIISALSFSLSVAGDESKEHC